MGGVAVVCRVRMMDDPLADCAPGGSMVGGESNVNALLASGAEAGSGGTGLLGGAEKLALGGPGS